MAAVPEVLFSVSFLPQSLYCLVYTQLTFFLELTYTAADIRSAIPASGISISELLKAFGNRIKGGGRDPVERAKFITMVKTNSVYNNQDKLLRPKPGADGDANMSG